ncbi:hypothetical protein GCM10010193_60470 [Kitasatospora atroaurantiaca]
MTGPAAGLAWSPVPAELEQAVRARAAVRPVAAATARRRFMDPPEDHFRQGVRAVGGALVGPLDHRCARSQYGNPLDTCQCLQAYGYLGETRRIDGCARSQNFVMEHQWNTR